MYSNEELKEIFEENKKIFDRVYESTKEAHNAKQANIAMYEYFVNWRTDFITRANNARSEMKKFTYHGAEIDQFLMEYAISSFALNQITPPKTLDEIKKYTRTNDPSLKYDKESIIRLVAVGAAWNPCWMSNVLSCNKKVKEALVQNLIEERYVQNKKEALDNCPKAKLIVLQNGKSITISVASLNRAIDSMINDDDNTYYRDDAAFAISKTGRNMS